MKSSCFNGGIFQEGIMRKLIFCTVIVVLLISVGHSWAGSKLVVYTVQDNVEARLLADVFMEKYPFVEVDLICGEQSGVINRLRGEWARKVFYADVVILEDRIAMEGLKNKHWLLAHGLARLDKYSTEFYDSSFFYFGTTMIPTGIVVGRNASLRPRAIKDLLSPAANGKIIMGSPLYDSSAAINMHSIIQHPELGWEAIYNLAKNGAENSNCCHGVLEAVARGDKEFGIVAATKSVRKMISKLGLDFVIPDEGASIMTRPVAVLATSTNHDAAKAYVDFMLSEQGQKIMASLGQHPAMSGISFSGKKSDAIKVMPLDVSKAFANDKVCRERFAAVFRK